MALDCRRKLCSIFSSIPILGAHLLALLATLSPVVSAIRRGCNEMTFEETDDRYVRNNIDFTLGEYEQKGQDADGVPYFVHYFDAVYINGIFIDKSVLYHDSNFSGWYISNENKNDEDGNTVWWKAQDYSDDGEETDDKDYLWPNAVKGDWLFWDENVEEWQADEVARFRCVGKKSDDEVISEVEMPFFIAIVILIFVGLIFALMAIVGAMKKKKEGDLSIQKSHVREAQQAEDAGGA